MAHALAYFNASHAAWLQHPPGKRKKNKQPRYVCQINLKSLRRKVQTSRCLTYIKMLLFEINSFIEKQKLINTSISSLSFNNTVLGVSIKTQKRVQQSSENTNKS